MRTSRMRRVRRIAAGLGLSLLLIALAGVALVLAVSAGWQRDGLRGWVEALASSRAGIPVRIRAIEGPLYPELTLRGLKVGSPEDPGIALEHAQLRWRMASWFPTPRPVLELAALSGLRLRVQQDAEGRLSLPLPGRPPAAAEPSEDSAIGVLPVHALELVDGRIELVRLGAGDPVRTTLHLALSARAPEGVTPALPLRGIEASLEARLEPTPLLRGQLEGAEVRVELSPDGRARAEARLEGALEDTPTTLTLSAELDLSAPRLDALPWSLERAAGQAPGVHFEAHGRGSGAEIETLDLTAGPFDLAWLASWIEARPSLVGQARLQAQIRGPVTAPELELRAEADALGIEGRRLGRLELVAHSLGPRRYRVDRLELSQGELPLGLAEPVLAEIADGQLRLEPATLQIFGQPVTIQGALSRDRFHALKVRAQGFEVTPLLPLVGLSKSALEGRIDVEAGIEGPLTRPEVMLQLARLALRSPNLAALATALAPELRVTGSAQLTAELEGPFAHPSGEIRMEARELTLEERSLGTLALRVISSGAKAFRIEQLELGGGEVTLTLGEPAHVARRAGGLYTEGLEIRVNQQPVIFRGGFEGGSLRDAHLETHDLSLADVAALAALGWPLAGQLSLALDLEGPPGAPRVRGEARWMAATVGAARLGDVHIALAPEAEGIAARARAVLEGRDLLVGDAFLPVRSLRDWSLAVLEDPRARLTVRGDALDLAALAPFLPRLVREPAGLALVELRVTGGRPRAEIEGQVQIREAGLSIPALGQRFAPIEGRLALATDELRVESLRIGAPDAGAQLAGRIGLKDLRPAEGDLRLELLRFPLARSPALFTDVSGFLEIQGSVEAPRLEGQLRLVDLHASLAAEEDPALREVRIVASSEEGASEPDAGQSALLEPLALDVRLEIPRNSWVRGRGAEVEIEGALKLRKDPRADPQITGSLQVVRGSYRFQGRRFDIRRGVVTFDGGSEPDPLLDLVAAYRVRDVTVLAIITGRASQPSLRLASEPPLPESDVLAYLVFGRPAREVAAGEQADLEATAVKAAAGMAASELSQLITQKLPIDTVDIRIDETGAPAELEVGKYLTENLFIRYGKGLGVDPEDEVRVELRLGPSWSVESEITSSGAAGADVLWTWEY